MHRKILLQIMRQLILVLAVTVSFIISSVTVIRAENAAAEAEKREETRAEAVERMRRGFAVFEESIDISDLKIPPEELGMLFADATKDTPYLFYVSNNLSYSYRTGGYVISVEPKYTMNRSDAEAAVGYCKREIRKMSLLLADRETELQKLAGAHDLICKRFTYDITLQSNNIYSFLKTGTGTCQGYTWTYMALLRELGIECHYVASDSIAHIWLAVKIDGDWYHSDVTWDDPPVGEASGEYNRSHLLFSDAKAESDGYADRYGAGNIKCEEVTYDGNLHSDIHPCALSGDADHNGQTTLYDLVLLRLHLEGEGNTLKDVCRVCSDANEDLNLDEKDAEHIRSVLLENLH